MMGEEEIVRRLNRCNWIVLAILTSFGIAFVNVHFALSVLLGGLIVIINFKLLISNTPEYVKPPMP